MSQCEGDAILLNDVVPNTNPYFTMEEFLHFRSGQVLKQVDLWDTAGDRKSLHLRLHEEIQESFPVIDYLLFSYEDKYFAEIVNGNFENSHDGWLGKSKRRLNLLIIRDPFNFFASRLKKWKTLTGIKDREELVEIWKIYAKEFLGITNYLGNNKITISFNDWFASMDYRMLLAKQLGIEFTDRGIKQILSVGPGSSFDEFTYHGQADKMHVLDRWQNFAEDSFFRGFFKDHELLELSCRIFGEIPGSEVLLA